MDGRCNGRSGRYARMEVRCKISSGQQGKVHLCMYGMHRVAS